MHIGIHDADFRSRLEQCGGQIYADCRFAHAAFAAIEACHVAIWLSYGWLMLSALHRPKNKSSSRAAA